MNEPTTRRRRRRRSDSSSDIDNSPILASSSESTIEDISEQPTTGRVRRKRKSDSPDISEPQQTLSAPSEHDLENEPDESLFSSPEMFSPITSNNIGSIRADVQHDIYHAKLAQSKYSDDSHDWGGDSNAISDDYWHFVGQYE